MPKYFTYVWGLRGPQPQIWHLERAGAAPIGGGKAIAPLIDISVYPENNNISYLRDLFPPPTSDTN